MQKILVVSDSHRLDYGIKKVMMNEGTFDRMIHLGDSEVSEGALYKLVNCPIDIVEGNCDSGLYHPKEKLLLIGKHKILILHGHTKGVNYGMERLINYGQEKEADIVMFGHTHRPFINEMPGMTIINPGSISLPRQPSGKPTWILMEVDDDGEIKFNFRELE